MEPGKGNLLLAYTPERMRLSAFSIVDALGPSEGEGRDRHREVIALAEAAEAGGLDALWVAEHHFQGGGLCPSPPVLLAACAERTHRLRLGSMVSVLPFHDPVTLAEEYALLDRICGGRLNLGVGSGYLASEFEGFGIDPASKRERFDRALDALLRGFAGDPVHMDRRGAAAVRLSVRPVQRPHPPLWIAVQRREALPFVAARGVSAALIPYATVGGLEELRVQIAEYRAHLPPGSSAGVSVGLHLYGGDHPELARAALQRYLDSRLASQSTFYAEKVHRHPEEAREESIEQSGFALFGTPAEVAERLERFRQIGVDEILGIFDFGGLKATEVHSSVRALAAARAPFATP